MATRTISGTLDTLEHEGSEITYKGSTDACDRSENIRGFQVNPGGTGDIIVKIDRSTGIKSVEIFQEDDYDIVKVIDSVLSSKVKPAIAQDGGDVQFQEYKEGVVYLRLKGSCAGCPSATQTLKNGIENLLKNKVPEVMRVEQAL